MAFCRVMALAELWSGEMVATVVDGKKLVVLRVDDQVFAYEDRCAHQGVALSEGRLTGTTLTCSAHQYEYDVCTGRGINPKNLCLRGYAVRLENGDVLVDVTASV